MIVESHDNPYLNNNTENSKIINPSKIMEDKNIIISQNITNNPGKNEFFELFKKRDKSKLFDNNKKLINDHYEIFKNNNDSVILKENEEKVNERIDQETNKYLNNKDINSLKIDEYRNVILNIANENNNKGKNNSIFMKYYGNILGKTNLYSILEYIKQIEIEKEKEKEREKELEKQKDLERKMELEREKQEKEIDEKLGNSNINLGKSFNLDYGEILERKNTNKKESIKESKFNKDNSEYDLMKKYERGGGSEFL